MKKFVALLFVLLALETWGVIGAARTEGIRYRCTMRVGPLCYAWEETAIAKLLGDDKLDEVEDAVAEAKEAWQKDVLDKLGKKKDGLGKVLEDVGDMAKEGAENAKKILEEKAK